jgi:hypothetical protein
MCDSAEILLMPMGLKHRIVGDCSAALPWIGGVVVSVADGRLSQRGMVSRCVAEI